MNKYLLSAIVCSMTLTALAESIDRQTALNKAKQFMPGKPFVAVGNVIPTRAGGRQDVEPLYVFNAESGDGYVIVAGEEGTNAYFRSVFNGPDEPVTYERSSSTSDFTDVSISSLLSFYAWQPATAEVAIAMFQGDDFVALLKQERDYSHDGCGTTRNRNIDELLSFGSGLASGSYELCLVYRFSANDEWQRCDNHSTNSLVAEISDNTMTLRRSASIKSFEVKSLIVAERPEINKPLKISAEVCNTGEVERLQLGVWMQEPGRSVWTQAGVRTLYAAIGETIDFVYSFTPSAMVFAHLLCLKVLSG